ncbi:zinc ribbon domain-containing protein [Pontibacillus sp. ALD_SL1]|uniref:CHY zinc finger protein n=1 Tax=Pontibacillus sp. ALD_SL1 TaxID=2777185 RepID=UPI001A97590A|nr:CHY zinc finger protein [Pontibacillus sp. ALD_SL1]QSS99672.1 zinc ribbon domain-containing protein [Pontibacillus sp. ALD_SL1]
MICSNCNHEQESGKFCGNCGFELSAGDTSPTPGIEPVPTSSPASTARAGTAPPPPNENVEKAKAFSKGYFQEVMGYVKQPNKAFSASESQFGHGLVTIGLYVVLFVMSIYVGADNFLLSLIPAEDLWLIEGSAELSLPFWEIAKPGLLFITVLLAASLGSIAIFNMILQNGQSLKLSLSKFGNLLSPLLALNGVALLLFLTGISVKLAVFLLVVSLMLVVTLIPSLFIYHYSLRSAKSQQAFYWAVLASLTSTGIAVLFVYNRFKTFIDELGGFGVW